MVLTIPVVAEPGTQVLTPTSEWMKLVGAQDELLYGFHGSTATKQPFLSGVYEAADKKGALSDHRSTFYLVDMTYRAPEVGEDEQYLYGQLPAHLLTKTPFIIGRRLATETAFDLGQLWQTIAKDIYGLRKVAAADINWTKAEAYMLEFPEVASSLFAKLPKLKCILMPMRTKIMPVGQDICWVGVAPKSKASKVDAEVRHKPGVRVDLKFK